MEGHSWDRPWSFALGRLCDELERCAILPVAATVESLLRWNELNDEFSCEDVVVAIVPGGSGEL